MPKFSLFVATTGNDDNPGSETQPFATLQRARQAVRELKAGDRLGHGVTVCIRGGVYECSEPFWLDENDSGTEQAPVIYSAYPGETPVLSGGRQIPPPVFKPVTDAAVLKRLQPEMRDRVLCADLRALGMVDYGAMAARGFGQPHSPMPMMLYCNGQPMEVARWPVGDYALTGPVATWNSPRSEGDAFTFDQARLTKWASAPDPWVHGFWHWDWADQYLPVSSIDQKSQTVQTSQPGQFRILEGRRFYILNLIEELDQPGEWYLDREGGLLYFYPPCALTDCYIVVSVLQDSLISLDNCSYVTLRGLVLEYGRDKGIMVRNGSYNLIEGCSLRNLSASAICIGNPWTYENTAADSTGGHNNGVRSCEINNIGWTGIVLSGGDRKTLVPAGNYAINNHIHHVSLVCKTYQPAIEISGVGNHVAHNDIHHAPHMAVWLSGNDHLIEYNRITDVVLETDDAGAIYAGRNPGELGNVIRNNYFSDIGNQLGHGTAAVYLDDGECGVVVEGNIFHRSGTTGRAGFGAVFINGGRFNDIRNNIFYQCEMAIGLEKWDEKAWSDFLGGRYENGLIPKRIFGDEIDIRDPLYISSYPELSVLTKPCGENRIDRNLAISCGRFLDLDQRWRTYNKESAGTAEIHSSPLALQYQCRLAREKIDGFEPIPFEQMGILKDRPGPDSVACATGEVENMPWLNPGSRDNNH